MTDSNVQAVELQEKKMKNYSIIMNGDQQELFSIVDLLSNNKWTKKYDNFEAAFYSWRNSHECPFIKDRDGFYCVKNEVKSIYERCSELL